MHPAHHPAPPNGYQVLELRREARELDANIEEACDELRALCCSDDEDD